MGEKAIDEWKLEYVETWLIKITDDRGDLIAGLRDSGDLCIGEGLSAEEALKKSLVGIVLATKIVDENGKEIS